MATYTKDICGICSICYCTYVVYVLHSQTTPAHASASFKCAKLHHVYKIDSEIEDYC